MRVQDTSGHDYWVESDSFISCFLFPFSVPPNPLWYRKKEVAEAWPVGGRPPTCLKGLGEKGLAVSGGGASSNHKYKFYSRSLSPFVFLGGAKGHVALCMSNSKSAPPGWMMDGSERREQARAHTGLPGRSSSSIDPRSFHLSFLLPLLPPPTH